MGSSNMMSGTERSRKNKIERDHSRGAAAAQTTAGGEGIAAAPAPVTGRSWRGSAVRREGDGSKQEEAKVVAGGLVKDGDAEECLAEAKEEIGAIDGMT